MTTNHAEVIRKALFHSNLPIFIYEAAITALDDITRELDAEIEEGERLNRAMCEQQATIAAQAERIKALEEEIPIQCRIASSKERERIIALMSAGFSPVQAFRWN